MYQVFIIIYLFFDTSATDRRVHAGVWKLAEHERARFEYLVSSKQQYGQMSSDAYETRDMESPPRVRFKSLEYRKCFVYSKQHHRRVKCL